MSACLLTAQSDDDMPPKKPDASSPEEERETSKFQFVVSTTPAEARSKANQKRVRSVAALKSWPERRKKTFENQDASSQRGGFVLDTTVAAPKTAGPSRPPAPESKKRKHSPDPEHAVLRGVAVAGPLEAAWPPADEDLFERCTRAENPGCNCVHCRTERRYRFGPSQGETTRHVAFPAGLDTEGRAPKRIAGGQAKLPAGDLAMVTPPSSPGPRPVAAPPPTAVVNNVGRAEPFACYPVPYRPWFDRVLHHMMTVFAPRGWPALKITNDEGLSWEWFMTQHALAEPALFYVRLLFASGDMIRLKVLKPDVSYWLQAQAIQSINEALRDPKRAASDSLILAVGRIALHENLYGSKQAASAIHRPAQKRMIDMRGGMRALPFPELVKRLMRWSDKVMAMQSGTPRLLEDELENKNFTMEQHVNVLSRWDPNAGEDLRTKIKISDLLAPEPSKSEDSAASAYASSGDARPSATDKG